jgi:hypothetical protein
MATTEERITATEKAIAELNTNSTILLGLASDHEIDIRRVSVQITELRTEMNQRFDQVNDELAANTVLLRQLLQRLDSLKPGE